MCLELNSLNSVVEFRIFSQTGSGKLKKKSKIFKNVLLQSRKCEMLTKLTIFSIMIPLFQALEI
jgi:hypothetical protein